MLTLPFGASYACNFSKFDYRAFKVNRFYEIISN